MKKTILAADLFCGAGGTSQGLLMAANEMEADLELIAINHWEVAIDTHSTNHPYAKHLCTGMDSVDPRKLVPGGRLNVMCASPECTHFSNARGGKPCSDQSRASAWHVLRFAEALYIDNIIIENVREFLSWGPLGANGRPLKSKRGQLFEQFIANLKALGYNVEWRVLNCADYGDPTTRERLFIIARRGRKPIHWPEPTHVPARQIAAGGLFKEERKTWRTAREVIDWSIASRSIFGRKKPLAENTLRRIEAGLRKFCGIDLDLRKCIAEDLRPFLVVFRGNMDSRSVDEPVPTVATSGAHVGLVQPFLVQAGGPEGKGRNPQSIDGPVATVVTENHTALVQPFLMQTDQTGSNSDCVRSADSPLATVVTKQNTAVIEPYIVTVTHSGEHERTRSINAPMATVTGSMGEGVVEPFVIPQHSGGEPRHIDNPLPTVATKGAIELAQPFLIAYYGTQNMSSVEDPVPTATTKARFGLVETKVERYLLDIRFRMLTWRELARAQGFPDSYQFSGNREDVVKQIGNAVPPHTAKALISEVLA